MEPWALDVLCDIAPGNLGESGTLFPLASSICMEHPETSPEPWRIGHFEQRLITTRMPDGRPKTRELWIPDDKARAAHIEMLGYFYGKGFVDTTNLRPETNVNGGMPGSRVLDNVLPHKENELFYMIDLKDAFRNVVYWKMEEKLVTRDPENKKLLEHFLDQYAMMPLRGLPQGAPCSPYLFNFYLAEMDHELDAYCAEFGITYTRWLDDLTFSYPFSGGALGKKARQTITDIIQETKGMKVNHAKSRLHRLSNAPVTITGVSIYPEGQIEAAPHIIKAARAAFQALDRAIQDDVYITPDHLAVPNGYYGALTSMSLAPFSPRIRRAINYYHDVASMAHNTMALQEEIMHYAPDGTQPWQIPEEFRAIARRADDIRVAIKSEERGWKNDALAEEARTSSDLAKRHLYDQAVWLSKVLRVDIGTAFVLNSNPLIYELMTGEKILDAPLDSSPKPAPRIKKAARLALEAGGVPLFDDDSFGG